MKWGQRWTALRPGSNKTIPAYCLPEILAQAFI